MALQTQLIRYGLIGLGLNGLGYLAYLLITSAGMGHKSAMSALYVLGTTIGFVLNRRWTFQHKGKRSPQFIRYVVTYIFGYLFNLIALIILVDFANLPHQLVQGVLIFVTAGLLFISQKLWVFRKCPEDVGHYQENGR